MANSFPIITSYEELLAGYRAAAQNALALLDSSLTLLSKNPAVALALAQIGLEELGKAYLLLHAGSLPAEESAWSDFWRTWRNHERKAAGAFMFEWINPVVMQFQTKDGRVLDGFPLRESFLQEKNAGLYIDYDASERRFITPRGAVATEEAASRLGALLMLADTALKLHDLITVRDSQFRYSAVSAIVSRLRERFTLQQDVHKLLDAMGQQSPEHRQLLDELKRTFPACWRAEETRDDT